MLTVNLFTLAEKEKGRNKYKHKKGYVRGSEA